MINLYPFSVFRGFLAHRRLRREARVPRKRWLGRLWRLSFGRGIDVLSTQLTGLVLVGLLGLALFPVAVRHWTPVLATGTEAGCLALNAYRERQVEGAGKRASAADELMAISWTVQNRLAIGFRQAGSAVPRSLCDVVYEPHQYSWTMWGEKAKFGITDKYAPDFYRAFRAAVEVIGRTERAMEVRKAVQMADHYFNPAKVMPRWAEKMAFVATIGYHDFYVELTRNDRQRALTEAREMLGHN